MKKPLQFPVTTVLILCSVVTFKMHHLNQGTEQSFNLAMYRVSGKDFCFMDQVQGWLSLTSTLASSRPTASICLTPGSPVSKLRLKLVILTILEYKIM